MKTYLEPEDVTIMEEAATNLRDRLLVRLLFRLGCRISEALAITVEHIDFSQRSVSIDHLKIRINLACFACGSRLGKSHSFCPACGVKVEKAVTQAKEHKRRRSLPLDFKTLSMIREYVAAGGPVLQNGKQLLFGIGRGHAWRIITELARKTCLGELVNIETGKTRKVSPHRLRECFAIHAVKLNDSGDGLRLLQEHLGHQSIITTMRYRKVAGEEHREWFDKLWQES